MGFDVKNAIRNVAPWLATAFGGPFGPAAAAITGAILGKPDAKEDDIADLVNAAIAKNDPALMLKLKQADNDFMLQMRSLEINSTVDLERLAVQDRDSARNRQIQLKDKTPQHLCYIVVVWVAIVHAYVLMHGLPLGFDGVVLGRIMGTQDSALMLGLGYFWGSSSANRQKDDTINQMVVAK